jgi:hypothetical protein
MFKNLKESRRYAFFPEPIEISVQFHGSEDKRKAVIKFLLLHILFIFISRSEVVWW